jgi:NAD(P)-dependent dehydrogenase (short-subunit alcohol dehydrogenase family)
MTRNIQRWLDAPTLDPRGAPPSAGDRYRNDHQRDRWPPRHNAKRSGAIVNITTIAAHRGIPGTAAYGSSKAALESLTRAWAVEFGGDGIRVNAVAPGHTKTENVTAMIGEEEFEQIGAGVPLRRLADPKEIAEAILFLASPRASYITGTTLAVDGGALAQA